MNLRDLGRKFTRGTGFLNMLAGAVSILAGVALIATSGGTAAALIIGGALYAGYGAMKERVGHDAQMVKEVTEQGRNLESIQWKSSPVSRSIVRVASALEALAAIATGPVGVAYGAAEVGSNLSTASIAAQSEQIKNGALTENAMAAAQSVSIPAGVAPMPAGGELPRPMVGAGAGQSFERY